MELRQLRYFVSVASTLNFSEAAKQLFITQGTLSQQIRQLENEVGSQLFERSSHHVTLTEAGEELLPLAKKTIEASEDCKSRMNDLRGTLSGSLNIGVTHSFSRLLTDTLKAFLKQNPGVTVKVYYKTATELVDMLREKNIDLALAFKSSVAYEDIESELLFTSQLSAVMRKGHRLANKKAISISDIEHVGIALPGSGLQARRAFERFVGLDTRNMDVRIELNEPNIIMDILGGTDLVAIISSLASYYMPNLVAIPLEGINGVMRGCIHRLKEGYRKHSADVFIEMIRESAKIDEICRKVRERQ